MIVANGRGEKCAPFCSASRNSIQCPFADLNGVSPHKDFDFKLIHQKNTMDLLIL